jgi:hypothetical protein
VAEVYYTVHNHQQQEIRYFQLLLPKVVVEEVEVGIVQVLDIQEVQEEVDQDQLFQEQELLNLVSQEIQAHLDLEIQVVMQMAEAELAEAEH